MLKSGAGKSSLDPVDIDGVQSPSACRFMTIHTDGNVSTKRLCHFTEDLYICIKEAMILTARVMKSQIQSLIYFGAFLVILAAWTGPVLGDERQRHFQLARSDHRQSAAED